MANTPPPPEQGGFDAAKLYLWIKALEGKVNNLLREVDLIKNDFTKKSGDLKKDLKALNNDFMEYQHEQQKTSEKMDLIIKELRQTAGSEEVQVIKRYIELWNPLNFVTQRDLERMVENKLKNPEVKEKIRLPLKEEKHSPFN